MARVRVMLEAAVVMAACLAPGCSLSSRSRLQNQGAGPAGSERRLCYAGVWAAGWQQTGSPAFLVPATARQQRGRLQHGRVLRTPLQAEQRPGGSKDEVPPQSPPPRLGARRPPRVRNVVPPPGDASVAAPEGPRVQAGRGSVLRKAFEVSVILMTFLVGLVRGTLGLCASVLGYYMQRKRRPFAAYLASWIVHKVLVSVCEDVQGLQVRVDAESSLALLRGEVTGVTIMASRVTLLDVSVGDVGIYTDDVRFVQADAEPFLLGVRACPLMCTLCACKSSRMHAFTCACTSQVCASSQLEPAGANSVRDAHGQSALAVARQLA